jgi:hypothetical protein
VIVVTDLLIYVPGLPKVETNTGEAVADVVAASLDRTRPGPYRAVASTATAPRALRVTKSVLGPDDKPVLDVFELDYRSRMERLAPTGTTGVVDSVALTIRACAKLTKAYFRVAKSKRAKLQLTLALVATLALVFSTVVALVALAGSAGLLKGVAPSTSTTHTVAAAVGGGTLITWAALRRWLLAVADDVRTALRYLNADRHRDTITQTLDDAVDGLLDSGWTGKIHVLAYSFGSLVAVDALCPAADGGSPGLDRLRGAVTSLTTVGCPADAVRLFYPNYFAGRHCRVAHLPWNNVFNAADVFGSNLGDKDDHSEAAEGATDRFPGAKLTSVRYTREELSVVNVLALKGFRTHAGYWDAPDNASCFDRLVSTWVPVDLHVPAQAVPARAAKKAPVKH